MTQIDYPMVVHPLGRENGGGYVAYALDLPGCMADGETPAEALEELRQAIDEWVAEAVRLGRDVPTPGSATKRAREALKNLFISRHELIQALEASSAMRIDGLKDRVERIEAQIQEIAGQLYADKEETLSAITTDSRTRSIFA